ncbi:MAG: flagellin [Proteobacteria bacterium]|nr:flagellin [Pseudomonadota bacterium]
MSVINTNVSATIATNALIKNERAMSTAMERLSTGMRINSAKDDAAGLAISSRMSAMVTGLEMASKNANDAISMLEVAEGATLEISNMLIRMRELAVQSASGTYSDTDRDALDLEFGALMDEIDRIAKNTTWNTMSILNGADDSSDLAVYDEDVAITSLDIQLGPNSSQVMTIQFKSWVPSSTIDTDAVTADGKDGSTPPVAGDGQDNFAANKSSAFGSAVLYVDLGGDGAGSGTPTPINIDSVANASFAIAQLDAAILGVSNERAKYGAYMSRLEHSSDNLLNVAQNTDQSRSRIEDADYAAETSELARTQIISQAATAMLAQANQAKQGVLQLLVSR